MTPKADILKGICKRIWEEVQLSCLRIAFLPTKTVRHYRRQCGKLRSSSLHSGHLPDNRSILLFQEGGILVRSINATVAKIIAVYSFKQILL